MIQYPDPGTNSSGLSTLDSQTGMSHGFSYLQPGACDFIARDCAVHASRVVFRATRGRRGGSSWVGWRCRPNSMAGSACGYMRFRLESRSPSAAVISGLKEIAAGSGRCRVDHYPDRAGNGAEVDWGCRCVHVLPVRYIAGCVAQPKASAACHIRKHRTRKSGRTSGTSPAVWV